MIEHRCPSYEELAPLLGGDTVSSGLQTHIDGCPDCRRRLDDLRGDVQELRDASLASAPIPPPSRPAMIGKYFVVGDLDSGGQAVVYRALHPLLEQEVVIKLSREPLGQSSPDRHLLVAEGKVLARLDHPNLARVHDLDFHEDRPFLAMEYVRGPNLARFAAETPLTPRRAADLVAQMARALAVVHRSGVVHQDIKPQNILIGEDGRPRLIDFGLARLRHQRDPASSDPSGGTPAFMAPEQARGDAAVGPRSDLFGLGGVLYFLLTLHPPFAAASGLLALEKARSCDFDRDALKRVRVPRRLEAICLKALAARPEDRHARAEDLAEELERFARPRRRWLAVAALVLLAVLVPTGVWLATRPAPPIPGPETAHTSTPAAEVADLAVGVVRNDHYSDLKSALPLQPATDKLEVVAKVPAGEHGVLLYVDSHGNVQRLEAHASPADKFTRLTWPGDGTRATLEGDAPGTEFLLFCTAADATQLEGLEDLFAGLLPLPRLPPQVLVRLNQDEPNVQYSGFGPREKDPVAQVESKLDRLRLRLRDKHLSAILGVAYSH